MSTRTDRNQTFDQSGNLVSEQVVVVDTTSETNETSTRTNAEQAIDGLRTIAGSSGTLTAAQLSSAVRLLARVALHVIRITLGKHDAAD